MEETKTVTKYVVFRESLVQSIVADFITFGMIAFSIWFSAGSKFWTFICFLMLFTFLCGSKKIKNSFSFRSATKLKEWVDSEVTQNVTGDRQERAENENAN